MCLWLATWRGRVGATTPTRGPGGVGLWAAAARGLVAAAREWGARRGVVSGGLLPRVR